MLVLCDFGTGLAWGRPTPQIVGRKVYIMSETRSALRFRCSFSEYRPNICLQLPDGELPMSLSRTIWKITLAASVAAPFAAVRAQGTATPNVALVRGTVTDSSSHAPVPGAQIVAVGTTRGALTDSAGAYTLRIPPGSVTIRVQRIGYAPAQRTVTATLDGTATADFVLRAVSTVLSEVVVTGYGTQNRAQVTGAVTQVT